MTAQDIAVMHAAPGGDMFGQASLCGMPIEAGRSLWTTNLPNLVTCHVCRDLSGGAA